MLERVPEPFGPATPIGQHALPNCPSEAEFECAVGRHFRLTIEENELIKAISPIAWQSTCAAKRMVNILRPIRVSVGGWLLGDYLEASRASCAKIAVRCRR